MLEVYKPTKADIEKLKPTPDKLKISGDGVFASLQGEGITAGYPSVFLRLHFCNLACGVPNGWKCDTRYAWDGARPEYWQEPEDWSYGETSLRIENAWASRFGENQEKRLVVTGGEPLIQQKKIARLLEKLPDWKVEIETNGTIMPIPELGRCQFNCSPKLENSGNSFRRRYKPEVLKVINRLPKSQFKFVAIGVSDLEEIDSIANGCDLCSGKILIMPEGQTAEEVEIHADRIREAVEARGWKITLRNQLIWYGPKRRT